MKFHVPYSFIKIKPSFLKKGTQKFFFVGYSHTLYAYSGCPPNNVWEYTIAWSTIPLGNPTGHQLLFRKLFTNQKTFLNKTPPPCYGFLQVFHFHLPIHIPNLSEVILRTLINIYIVPVLSFYLYN